MLAVRAPDKSDDPALVFERSARTFLPLSYFQTRDTGSYTLLPFQFARFDEHRYLLTNFAGEYALLPGLDFSAFVHRELPPHTPTYDDLKSLHFLADGDSAIALELLAAKVRTKHAVLADFTDIIGAPNTIRLNFIGVELNDGSGN